MDLKAFFGIKRFLFFSHFSTSLFPFDFLLFQYIVCGGKLIVLFVRDDVETLAVKRFVKLDLAVGDDADSVVVVGVSRS